MKYSLDYTYLTDLEVDTRQTFSDLSNDLLLLDHKETSSVTFDATNLVSSWQDFFWKTDHPFKQNLNITFTDISIERNPDAPSTDYSGNPLLPTEMMSYGELVEFYEDLDELSGWIGDRTYTELCSVLMDAIEKLHNKLVLKKLYPVGSIVVSDSDPGNIMVGTQWTAQSAAYISESMRDSMQLTELSTIGYHVGHTMGERTIGTDLKNAIISAKIVQDAVPRHSHDLKFIPESGANGSADSPVTEEGFATYTGKKTGDEYSGYDTAKDKSWGLGVSDRASKPVSNGGEAIPDFSVATTSVNPKISVLAVAPKTYPLKSDVWERKEDND